MPLGGATKKLQKLVDTAEELYQRINELREEIAALRETVQDTNATVQRVERNLETQRALVEALAREQGVDVDRIIAETAIEEAEPADAEAGGGTADDSEARGVDDSVTAGTEDATRNATNRDGGGGPDSTEPAGGE